MVTVAICTHNRAHLLPEAAASVLGQTCRDLELVLCDDGSADDTPAVCAALAAADARVRVVRHRANVGMAANWAASVGHARGAFYAKLDDDNRYLPTFLDRLLAAMRAAPAAGFAFCDEWVIGPAGDRRPTESDDASHRFGRDRLTAGLQPDTAALAAGLSIGVNAALIARPAMTAAGGFRPWADADGDTRLFLDLAAAGVAATYVPDRLSEYRVHDGQTTLADAHANVARSAASIRVWDTLRFTGHAERLRRTHLAGAISTHVRTSLVAGDAAAARSWSRRGIAAGPLAPRAWAVAVAAHLPGPWVRRRLGSD